MSQFENFSSLSPAQEQTFTVYEERMFTATKSSFTIAGIVAAVLFVFSLGIYFGVTPEDNSAEMTKDMNMSNLSGPAAPAK